MPAPADLMLGKAPARRDPRTLDYARYRTGNQVAPTEAHWGHGLEFAMLANDQYGDCVEAAYGHQVQIWGARSGHPFIPTDAETLGAYTALTGFDPNDPGTDQGTDMLSAVRYWKSAGMGGQRIAAYATVNPLNQAQVRESVAWYGGLYIGLQLPVSAQGQVGGDWTVTSGPDAQAGSWGGHCVPVCGYSHRGLWSITWGQFQHMSWDFLSTYCDEAFVLLAQEWIAASGLSPSGLAWGRLMADLASL